MSRFRCAALDASGRRREFVSEAPSSDEASRRFSTGEFFLLSVEPLKARALGSRRERASPALVREFTEMTALLLESGMGLREALGIETLIGAGGLKDMARGFAAEIDKGDSFSTALERRSASYSPLFRGMVRIGERVGSLETVIPRLASYLKDRAAFRDRVMGALSYPVLVLAAALLGTGAVVFLLLPRLQSLLQGLGEGNASEIESRILYAVRLFRAVIVAVVAAAAAFSALLAARKRDGPAAVAIDRAALGFPVLGGLLKDWETLNFAFAMEVLTKGGVSMEGALAEAARTLGNAAYRSAILSAREDLLAGASFSDTLAARAEVPSYMARWVAAGERSGQTDRVFAQIRSYFQAEIGRKTARFAAVLEPALIVGVGGVVLFLVAAFVLPLFSLYGALL
jgi:type II secretory pathway component PulF